MCYYEYSFVVSNIVSIVVIVSVGNIGMCVGIIVIVVVRVVVVIIVRVVVIIIVSVVAIRSVTYS